jgi:hypothetical protein
VLFQVKGHTEQRDSCKKEGKLTEAIAVTATAEKRYKIHMIYKVCFFLFFFLFVSSKKRTKSLLKKRTKGSIKEKIKSEFLLLESLIFGLVTESYKWQQTFCSQWLSYMKSMQKLEIREN